MRSLRTKKDEVSIETLDKTLVQEESEPVTFAWIEQQHPTVEDEVYRVRAHRHDDHNLDIKCLYDFGGAAGTAEMQIFIFMPPSAQLPLIDKSRFMSDFLSRGRLFYSKGDSLKSEDLKPSEKIISIIANVHGLPDTASFVESDELTSQIRVFGSVLGELIKSQGEKQKRLLMMSSSLISHVADQTRLMSEMAREVELTYGLIRNIRSHITEKTANLIPVLKVLENYMHHVYVDYLGSIQESLQELRRSLSARGRTMKPDNDLQRTLNLCKSEEAQRASKLLNIGRAHSDREQQETAVLRYSHMKKFFQSTTFVDVARKDNIKKLNEPIAAFGAAFAAIAAAGLERMGSIGSMGVQGVAVMAAGVALYTIKDRLKDFIRNALLKRVARFVPDIRQDLYSEQKLIGHVDEWFANKIRVPDNIKVLRQKACISEPEKHIHEDLLYYKKLIRLNQEGSGRTARFFQDLLRVNFERYLKYLDDHEKSFRFLDEKGRLTVVKSHRVYHFHIGIEVAVQSANGKSDTTRFFRVVMDKNGIDRVEQLD